MGLPPSSAGPGQVKHFGRLHVGEGAEHLLKFRQVGEAGEAAAGFQGLAVRGDFHGLDDFAERGGPGVEMLDAALRVALRGRGSAAGCTSRPCCC